MPSVTYMSLSVPLTTVLTSDLVTCMCEQVM